MKIYIDGLLFLNFFIDFLLLLTTNIILKRKQKIINIIIGAFIGSLSTIILFLNINKIELFLIKTYISIIMCLVTFNYKDFKYFIYNITTLYIVSILFGGFLYFLKIQFKNNILFSFIIAPIILYIYIWQNKYIKKTKKHYQVEIKMGKNNLNLIGYLDTGNTLTFKGKPVIITNKIIKTNKRKILVPFNSIENSGILECIETKIKVINLGEFNVLLGYSANLNISGVDILLNNEMER